MFYNDYVEFYAFDKGGINKNMQNSIIIKGAKEHNLKNINLEIPRDKLVVITGLSGSRKVFTCF